MTITDQRLLSIRDALSAGRHKVLSVDIFDTLLWRRAPEPADAFLVLGQQLQNSAHLTSHISPVAFAELRRSAQAKARERAFVASGSREVSLSDIYAELPDTIFADTFSLDRRVFAELDCERDLMILDEEIVSLARHAKASGARVIFVSDTYFSSQNINEFLRAAGFSDIDLVDRVYVSCEAGKPKFLDLFDFILKDLGIESESLIHIGDNPDADVLPCRSRGIACVHYDKWVFSPRVQVREFHSDHVARLAMLGSVGDHGLTGLRSRLYHRPPQDLGIGQQHYWRYGASVLTPVFASFARWIVHSCQEFSARRVFGIMREGRFLGRIVGESAKYLGVDLVTEELWLSRRAVIRAALFPDDLSLLSEAISLCPGKDRGEVLSGLGLGTAEIEFALQAPFDLNDPGALSALAQVIAQTPALREKVVTHSARLRRNLLSGITKKIDLTQAGDVVVMDLGYAATIQTVLMRILEREGAKVKLRGLYLALNTNAAENLVSGSDVRAYLDHEGFNAPVAKLLSRTPDVLEHACMCSEGSLADYADTGEPELLPNLRATSQLSQMDAVQEGILAGLGAANSLLGDLESTPAGGLNLKRQISAIITTALLYPTRQESETIGAWYHEANFDLSDQRRLSDLLIDTGELEYKGWSVMQEVGRDQCYWPAGALTLVDPFIADIFSSGAGQGYEPDHLTSGSILGGLAICPDLGVGFGAKQEGVVPLAVDVFGRGEITLTIKSLGPDVYQRLRLRFPPAMAVLSLDELMLTYDGEHEHRTIVFSEGGGFDRLTWKNVEHEVLETTAVLGKNMEVTIDLSDDTPSWLHAVHLRLRYKYLRLERLFQ